MLSINSINWWNQLTLKEKNVVLEGNLNAKIIIDAFKKEIQNLYILNIQTLKPGTRVVFDHKEHSYEEWNDDGDCPITEDEFNEIQGKECIIISLETFCALGEQDHEYYNIKFDDGLELVGVSGYNLNLITTK